MANPFTTGPFNCCTCPEPPGYDPEVDAPLPKYISKCGCPTVVVVCASEEKTATLCGTMESSGFESSPPLKYRVMTETASGSWDRSEAFACPPGSDPFFYSTIIYSGSGTCAYSDVDCSTTTGSWQSRTISRSCNKDTSPSSNWFVEVVSDVTENEPVNCIAQLDDGANWSGDSSTKATLGSLGGSLSLVRTLSGKDTEADALARETATTGTSCSSLYQLRTTSFSFTQRTATYTATASNLVVGVQYEGCVRIQRREAYSGTLPVGADTAWYDVEPDTIAAFTPTSTEEEVATDVALPIEQGWEYKIAGAYVWPTSAGCDCPTSYVAP